ncbi:MAG: NnrU family protein [Pseudomonadota bacterium]
MALLILGMASFMVVHLFAAFRTREAGQGLRNSLGEGPYMGLFSLLSIASLALIVYGYGAARPAPILYQPPVALQHLNLVLMLIAMIVLAAAYTPTGYIKRAVKHPMVLAVKIWAVGHLLANGELNSVILFGGFLIYGVLSRIAAKRRGDNGPGPDAAVSLTGDIAAIAVGLVAYGSLAFYLHPILFGVAAVPAA